LQEVMPMGPEFPLCLTLRVPYAPNDVFTLGMFSGIRNLNVWVAVDAEHTLSLFQAALNTTGVTILFEPLACANDHVLHCPEPADPTQPRVLKKGDDATILAFGAGVSTALNAANELYAEGIDAGVIDLQCVLPVQSEPLSAAIQKTGRPIFVEAPPSVLKEVVDGSFWQLESPPQHAEANSLSIQRAVEESLRY